MNKYTVLNVSGSTPGRRVIEQAYVGDDYSEVSKTLVELQQKQINRIEIIDQVKKQKRIFIFKNFAEYNLKIEEL